MSDQPRNDREIELLDQLAIANRHLQIAQQAANIATVYRERGGDISLSPEFHRMLGLREGEPYSDAGLRNAVHPLDLRRVDGIKKAFETARAGRNHRYEHRILRREGDVRWLRWILRREVDPSGATLSVSGTVQDITAQRALARHAQALQLLGDRRIRDLHRLTGSLEAATRLLARNAAFLGAVLDTVPQGVAVFDEDMKLAAWNRHMPALTEIDAGALTPGMPFDRFAALHWRHDLTARGDHLHRDRTGDVIPQSFERRLSDGRTVQANVTLRSDGGIIKTYADITAFKNAEQRLRSQGGELAKRVRELERLSIELGQSQAEAEQANRVKSQFLAMMSHDIRTPMNGLLGMMAMLAETELKPEQDRQLSLARRAGDQLHLLLDDIIDIVRADAGKLNLQPTPLNLGQTIDGVVEFWKATRSDDAIHIEHRIDPALPSHVLMDHTRFRQLLDNLISNAIKYTRLGRVRVALSRRPGLLLVEVEDSGQGISSDLQALLFTDFSRLRTIASDTTPGVGLGLAICRRLVDAMGGRIGVESEAGSGSRFWIELPLVPAEPPPAATPLPGAEIIRRADGSRPHVLIAEDIETNRVVLRAMVESMGCDAEIAVDGEQAVAAARTGRFDVVLMDVLMPNVDGTEATRRIRRLGGRFAALPIIGVTAHALHSERGALIAAGMSACISKPLDKKLLYETLRVALRPPIEGADLIDVAVFRGLFVALPIVRRSELLDLALADTALLATEFQMAVVTGDPERARRAAHSLKGVSGNFGAWAIDRFLEHLPDMESAPLPPDKLKAFETMVAATLRHGRALFVELGLGQAQ